MKPHKHAEVIHAWADGAEVQMKWESAGWQDSTDPVWYPEWEYRIKPAEKVVRWLWAWQPIGTNWSFISEHRYTDEEVKAALKDGTFTKLEWSREELTNEL